MSTTKQKRKFGYGGAAYLPNTVTEGQDLYATDTLKHTFDTNNQRLDLTPTPNWNETNPDSPAFVRNKRSIDDILNEIETVRRIQNDTHIYGVKWDKTSSAMERIYDAAGITTDTTNFVYSGSVNPNYNNPFDKLYPWSECKQCNVDLTLYRALSAGDDIRDAVVAWYGDNDFATDGSNGFVGRYTPEFWYLGYERDNVKYIFIADKEVKGFLHHKPSIRSHGFGVDDGNNGVTSNDGQPMTNVAVSSIHSKATAGGFTLLDVYEYDANVALFMVEFASTDSQAKLGSGCSEDYYSPNFTVIAAETGATAVLLPAAGKNYCIPGATLDFATSKDGVDLSKRRTVVNSAVYNSDYCRVTFTPAIDLTTSLYPSIHGKNNADSIGNKSGYIGVNGKNNAWYRGAIMYANRWQYILGAYRQTGTNHLWLSTIEDCDNCDDLNTSDHFDTGVTQYTPSSESWQSVGDYGIVPGKLAAFGMITKAASLTGDSQYCPLPSAGNTICLLGGRADGGSVCGVLCAHWYNAATASYWGYAAVPLLRSP